MKQISEKDCWFVIGAHQAGATERQCADLSGLSKTIIHNIITNFKKLGSPHASNLSVNALMNTQGSDNKRKMRDTEESKNTPRKRGRPRKPIEAPFFTRSIVREALKQARTDQPMYNKNNNNNTSLPAMYLMDRLNTPPTDEESHRHPPENKEEQEEEEEKTRRESIKEDMLPSTPRSIVAVDESDDDESGNTVWSMEDDKKLLEHVLGLPMKSVKWKAVETQFDDRHLAKMCSERWDYLKKQLIKDAHHVLAEQTGAGGDT